MPQYAVLIWEAVPADELPREVIDAHIALDGKIADAGGRSVAGLALQPASTATVIRGGELTDGPFIETKEALGGYYVIEARDLDQALELAKICPSGNVEVRPVMDTSASAQPPA